jgi:hypothetical protein
VACGVGTQALGLAQLGHTVTSRDLSPGLVAVYGCAPKDGKEVAILTRSMLEILLDLSTYVEVRGEGVAQHVPSERHSLPGPLGDGVQRARAAVLVTAFPLER